MLPRRSKVPVVKVEPAEEQLIRDARQVAARKKDATLRKLNIDDRCPSSSSVEPRGRALSSASVATSGSATTSKSVAGTSSYCSYSSSASSSVESVSSVDYRTGRTKIVTSATVYLEPKKPATATTHTTPATKPYALPEVRKSKVKDAMTAIDVTGRYPVGVSVPDGWYVVDRMVKQEVMIPVKKLISASDRRGEPSSRRCTANTYVVDVKTCEDRMVKVSIPVTLKVKVGKYSVQNFKRREVLVGERREKPDAAVKEGLPVRISMPTGTYLIEYKVRREVMLGKIPVRLHIRQGLYNVDSKYTHEVMLRDTKRKYEILPSSPEATLDPAESVSKDSSINHDIGVFTGTSILCDEYDKPPGIMVKYSLFVYPIYINLLCG